MMRKLHSLGLTVTRTGKSANADWSQTEVANTIADYFDMLRLDLLGRDYNKTQHRTRPMSKLNSRNDGAVERKHQNISAILDEMRAVGV